MKINGQLTPEVIPAVVTYFHCKITKGIFTQDSDSDSLMSCRSLYWVTGAQMVTGLEMWAPDCCVFLRREHLSSLAVHDPSVRPSFPRNPREREGRSDERAALANTQGDDIWSAFHIPAQAERQWKKKKEHQICHIPAPKTGRESVWDGSSVSCYPHHHPLLLLLFLFWFKSWATLVEIWGG